MAAEPSSALKHLRTKVLGEEVDDGPYAKAFEELGLKDINDFMFIEPQEFKTLNNKLKVLQAQKLIHSQVWYRSHPSTGTTSIWLELTTEVLNAFVAQGLPTPQPSTTTPSTDQPTPDPISSSLPTPPTTSTPASDFIKSIKRDVTQYQELSLIHI